jgi:hypothetical protein
LKMLGTSLFMKVMGTLRSTAYRVLKSCSSFSHSLKWYRSVNRFCGLCAHALLAWV